MKTLRILSIIITLSLTPNALKAQIYSNVQFDKINNPNTGGTMGLIYAAVENDTLVAMFDGGVTMYDTNTKAKRRYVVYERRNNQWSFMFEFTTVQKPNEHITGAMGNYEARNPKNFVRYMGAIYIIGAVDSVIGLASGPAGIMVYENNQLKKLRYPGFGYAYYSAGSYAFDKGTLYVPMQLYFGQFDNRPIIAKYTNSVFDTVPYSNPNAYGYYIMNTDQDPMLFYYNKNTGERSAHFLKNNSVSGNVDMFILGGTGSDTTWINPEQMIYSNDTKHLYSNTTGAAFTWAVLERGKWKLMKMQDALPYKLRSVVKFQGLTLASSEGKIALYKFNRWNDVQMSNSIMTTEATLHAAGEKLYVAALVPYSSNENFLYLMRKVDASLNGHVFIDENNNCIKEGSEKFKKGALVRINPGNYLLNTDDEGRFAAFLDSNNYTFSLVPDKNQTAACSSQMFLDKGSVNNVGLGLTLQNRKDLSIHITSLTGHNARRGGTIYYNVSIRNLGSETVSSNLVVKLDPRTVETVDQGLFSRPDSFTLTYVIDSLKTDESVKLNFSIVASPNRLRGGDKINFIAAFVNYTDHDSTDNADTLRQEVVAAYDPNEKNCYPSVATGAHVKQIKYNIQFQNLGTDSAVKVTVVDTFDVRIPLDKVILTDCSHPYKVSLKNNVITWTFDNIMLPPAKQNYDKSMGSINFIAKLNQPLKEGDTIRNKAHIYFDYEEAVITNIAQIAYSIDSLTIGLPKIKENDQLLVYPNPSSGKLHIEFSGENFGEIEIINTLGVRVYRVVKTKNSDFYIDLENLAAGVYIIRDERGRTAKFIIQR